MARQAHGQGAKPPQGQETIVAAAVQAHIAMGLVEAGLVALIGA